VAFLHICNAMGSEGLLNMDRFDEFFDLSTILGEEVTPFRRDRMAQWFRDSAILLEEDDVPTNEAEFEAFQMIEEPIVKNLTNIFATKHKQGSIFFHKSLKTPPQTLRFPISRMASMFGNQLHTESKSKNLTLVRTANEKGKRSDV
jgi:hypothetical protein